MDYAIIKLGNKQHRVRHGETLVVDRLPADEGKSFEPVVLLGEGKVTATVLSHGRGPKILIGKYRKRTGYKRHNGFRAAVSRVEISLESTGGGRKTPAPKPAATESGAATEAVATPVPDKSAESTPVARELATAAEAEAVADEAAAPLVLAQAALPEGYEGMTVAQLSSHAKQWSAAELDAALSYERAHAARKGAISALEAAHAKEEG